MNIFRILGRLRAIGILITQVGELITRLGSAPSLTEIIREGGPSESDQRDMSQDSLAPNGGKDEEPVTDESRVQTGQSDLFETPKPE